MSDFKMNDKNRIGYNGEIELLAPAGNYNAFLGAVNAGADAVYLAGKMFGARAFADNFSDEELLRALDYAHLHNSKIYMTVNTLLKNRELDLLCEYIEPFYEAGLDGCIVQDLGVFNTLKTNFKGMELHASTQMTVSSASGAQYLKNLGFDRVVLSRELKSNEIKEITDMGIDTECFIHGSMCYCYSGQCLYSSLVGGRSGNRGRCAQPCRLKYSYNGKEGYYLSLKDMCTVEMLPEVLGLGIHSYKIEGRMKSEAYAAGVTSIYRKYIDKYLSDPDKEYTVDKKDLEILRNLYIRTDIGTGYYNKDRGKNMITVNSPSYAKTSDDLIVYFKTTYCVEEKKLQIDGNAEFKVGQSCSLKLENHDGPGSFEAWGDEVCEALKSPVTSEEVCKRIRKSGDTLFEFANLYADVDDNAFIPVGKINELRRNALDGLKEEILKTFRRNAPSKFVTPFKSCERTNEILESIVYFTENFRQAELLCKLGIKDICIPLFEVESEPQTDNLYIEMPSVIRNENADDIKERMDIVCKYGNFKGFYVNQYDSLALVNEYMQENGLKQDAFEIRGNVHFYKFNNFALNDGLNSYTVPVELKTEEIKHLNLSNAELFIYGKYPLMNTANCILNTNSECRKYKPFDGNSYIKDRYNKDIYIQTHCNQKICYNTLYNCVPTSLHNCFDKIRDLMVLRYQIRFTDESEERIKEVIDVFDALINGGRVDKVSYEYTNGHYFRGVE